MKLVTYVLKSDPSSRQFVGALTKDEAQVVDLQKTCETVKGTPSKFFENMIEFLTGAQAARELASELLEKADKDCSLAISDVKLLAPVPRPGVFRDTLCHEKHLIGTARRALIMKGIDPDSVDAETLKPGKDWYREPRYYKVNVNSVIGTDEEVTFPVGENFKDYELELAFFICKEGKDICYRDAMDYVGGYTIFNDFSARMLQLHEMDYKVDLGPNGSKDFANAMGPCMVTPDAFNYEDAKMTVRVNGQVRGGGNHGECYHKIPDIIAFISSNVTLYPGDVIATGTVGTGAGIETGMPLFIDDVVELEIEGIGKLRNKIVPPHATKVKNIDQKYKRFVCGPLNGKSAFVIDDYPDVWKSAPGSPNIITDAWRVNEMPAKASATAAVDMGNLPVEHEPPAGSGTSIFRHVPFAFPEEGSVLDKLPAPMRAMTIQMVLELHRSIGTKNIPSLEDLKKDGSMHRTETLNMFFCSEGALVALNDLEDVYLNPGDTLIQLGGMHGWRSKGTVSGLLVSADMSSFRLLTEKPKPTMTSKLNHFKRYVTGTMKSTEKEAGLSDNLIVDYSPNEAEIFDKSGKHIGFAGEIWKTYGPNADMSGAADAIIGPMEAKPPKGGITFRMIDLLPGCALDSDESILNYYSVVTGQLTAVCDERSVVLQPVSDLVQLKGAKLSLKNETGETLRLAHYMIDAE